MIAVDLVAAAKTGDQAAFATHDARWTANIDEIAAFLAGANPNWPEKDVLDLLALHLKLTKDEAVARITGDWAADVKAFDDIFTEIMVLADALHDGIVAQFPERFADVGAGMTRARPGRGVADDRRRSRSAPGGPRSRACSAPMASATASRPSPTGRSSCSIFSSNRCPTAKAYARADERAPGEYGPRGVQLSPSTRTTRTSIPDESYRADGRARRRGRLHVPVPRRRGQLVARAYGATCTFHVFVLDRRRRLRYQGRFDDSRTRRQGHEPRPPRTPSTTSSPAARSGSPTTRPFGCSLDLV